MSRDSFDSTADGALGSPWLAWTSTAPTISDGKAYSPGDATRPETIGPDSFCESRFAAAITLGAASNFGVGVRLTAHSGAANGYMFDIAESGGAFVPKLYKGSAFTVIATGAGQAGSIDGIRITAAGSAIKGYFRIGGVWTEVVSATDTSYAAAGYAGFWVQGGSLGVDSVAWGDGDGGLGSAASRAFARFAPLAYEDDGTLENLTAALMAPVEVAEISRDTDTLVAWESLFDPDACPAELLDWLAVYNGVVLPASATTAADKRYRIKQAAGRYRGTPRALAEEVQIVLTGTKTVLLGYDNGDQWHYIVGTLATETPDTAAVDRAIDAQNPAFMLGSRVLTSAWSWFVLAPTLIAERVGDEYTLSNPTYPTWTSVGAAFATWTALVAGPP